MSIRRACAVPEVDTPAFHHKARRPDQAVLEGRVQEIRAARVRQGHRRAQVPLRREGRTVDHKETRRVHGEAGLGPRDKTPKRRAEAEPRDDRVPATRPNGVRAMDSVHGQPAAGRKIRVPTVVDTSSRFSPAVDVRFGCRAEDAAATLGRVCARGVALGFSRPGKPTDSAFTEASDGRFRSECLNAHRSLTLPDAAEKMEDRPRHHNEGRPRGAIGHEAPLTLLKFGGDPGPPP